jgi:aspartyl protease family protein
MKAYGAVAAISFVAGLVIALVAEETNRRPPMPQQSVPVEGKFGRAVRVPVSGDNECLIPARAAGRSFTALIDTGADVVYLDRPTARLLGFDPSRLSFTGTVRDATGTQKTASIRLPELDVSGFVLRDVYASVKFPDLDHALIGMSVLKRLGRFEVANGNCILSW